MYTFDIKASKRLRLVNVSGYTIIVESDEHLIQMKPHYAGVVY